MVIRRGGRLPACVRLELGVVVASADHRIVTRVLIAGALVLTVGLAGCGRKAALDPPPSASTYSGATDNKNTPPPAKPDKPFFLDWLL